MSALPHPIPNTRPAKADTPVLRLVGRFDPKTTNHHRAWAVGGELSPLSELGKRLMDLILAAVALTLLAPVMLTVAAWVRITDGGPVIYRQWRMGQNGKQFRIYKFRTMRRDAEADGPRFAQRHDSRVLPGCGWVRKAHADELPQLINILRGEMSLVGPRPERPELHEAMRAQLPGIERRLAAKPGLTGLAQVRNGYTNDLPGMRRKLALDLHYLRRRGLAFDAWLLLATVIRLWDPAAA